MKKQFLEKLKTISRFWWILLAILLVGIILRTYNFHDWLRFNADQGRDAEMVSAVLNGQAPLPLLGPKAGGTEFRLGPAFYYFEITSAKIFGDYPDKMAYPDLLTGILCIPLLFFFLRKYFDKSIALSMAAIFAVSNYAIRFSRFAWNPNSTPFWTILALYAIAEVVSKKQKRKFLWSAIAGIAIGIGVQLHTTLLLFLPITVIIIFGYLALKNKMILKYFFVILAMSLFLNIPQLVSEYQHHGENIKAFFEGVKTKQENTSWIEKITHGTSCWVQGNTDIVSGYEISDTCLFKPEKNKDDLAVFILGAIFVLGGTILGIRYMFKEKDFDRKSFLAIVSVFTVVSFLVFLKLAFELSVRFYLILIFLPFLLLGFWWKFIVEKVKHYPLILPIILCVFLILSNLYFVHRYFMELDSYGKNGGTVDVTILEEAEEFSQFVVANSKGMPQVYIDGNKQFLFKSFKSMRYLTGKSDVDLLLVEKNKTLPNRYFYVAREQEKEALLADSTVEIVQYEIYSNFTILLLQKNSN